MAEKKQGRAIDKGKIIVYGLPDDVRKDLATLAEMDDRSVSEYVGKMIRDRVREARAKARRSSDSETHGPEKT